MATEERQRAPDLLRVGELAERTGLTVRTLHHYDQIGLLTPAARSRSGYRLYDAEAVERLTKILLLKHLGLSLDEIRDLLEGDGLPLGRTLALQIERLRQTIAHQTRLLHRLESLAARLDPPPTAPSGQPGDLASSPGSSGPSVDDLTETLELLTAVERHFTAEQLDTLAHRRKILGEETLREAETDWPELIAAVRAAMERGDDPASAPVQHLAARWRSLVEQFTGGDPSMAESVRSVYRHEPAIARKSGLDPKVLEYIARANAAARQG